MPQPQSRPVKGDARGRNRRKTLGRDCGGFGTKACVVAGGQGRAIASDLVPGQAHEPPGRQAARGSVPCMPKRGPSPTRATAATPCENASGTAGLGQRCFAEPMKSRMPVRPRPASLATTSNSWGPTQGVAVPSPPAKPVLWFARRDQGRRPPARSWASST